MRVSRVSFVDWFEGRLGTVKPQGVLPPTMSYWQPESKEAPVPPPPAPEPNKGVYFDAWV